MRVGPRCSHGPQEILAGDTWLQCWDNSTRGLDSATALNFVKTMSASTRERGSVAVVSLYQASQDIYNVPLSPLSPWPGTRRR